MTDKSVDLGSTKISKKVLADIIFNAVVDLEDVDILKGRVCSSLLELLKIKTHSGINIVVDQDQAISIDIKVVVGYGINIPEKAKEIQESISKALKKAANIKINNINVSIQGINRRKE